MFLTLLFTAACLSNAVGQDGTGNTYKTLNGKQPLGIRVVYVGAARKFERTNEWMNFLKASFEHVSHVRSSQFVAADYEKTDVFVFDQEQSRLIETSRNSIGIVGPPAPKLPPGFDRASILIGFSGTNVARSRGVFFDDL